ncbi:MAG TPA: hypothetical protein VN541_06435 [Tepidisphaeraceae bacterium]|nr:hypothetical protein [Tepidisphaeraceae bacterium]
MPEQTRREFLAEVGRGMIATSVGMSLAAELGMAPAQGSQTPDRLEFGDLEPLVALMQETPVERLLPVLAGKLKSGTDLRTLAAAAALANARTFGGEDYVGFHTMMALAPAVHMAAELPPAQQPLPVFKVLYRNTNRIHEHGGPASEVLKPVAPARLSQGQPGSELLRDAVRRGDTVSAEQTFAALAATSADEALNDVIASVEDATEVHRVVLPYRSWDMLGLIGREYAGTLLRQSVRYCLKEESRLRGEHATEPRRVLPKALEQYHLLGKTPGTRKMDDQWIDDTSMAIFRAAPAQAADIAAAALADGIAPDCVGQAISLATNQLILRDFGRTPADEVAGKPIGSVHGDSIGVHACDSSNAWRNLARVGNTPNTYACLILGAYQAALDRVNRGGDFLHWQPLPLPMHLEQVKQTDAAALLHEADAAIRGNLQAHACAIVARYGQMGHPPRAMFDLLLKFAVSEDGALHAEKFYRTNSEEFAAARPAFRWRYLIALARVTASEYGRPAPGYSQARELLGV